MELQRKQRDIIEIKKLTINLLIPPTTNGPSIMMTIIEQAIVSSIVLCSFQSSNILSWLFDIAQSLRRSLHVFNSICSLQLLSWRLTISYGLQITVMWESGAEKKRNQQNCFVVIWNNCQSLLNERLCILLILFVDNVSCQCCLLPLISYHCSKLRITHIFVNTVA